ncbi:hypothetical protein C8Q72DRAFT_230617 [Fomitopsis betulina]|nr:hypothetical protein C8Q72DRAFT_230617 [Fomitopsis betulina]
MGSGEPLGGGLPEGLPKSMGVVRVTVEGWELAPESWRMLSIDGGTGGGKRKRAGLDCSRHGRYTKVVSRRGLCFPRFRSVQMSNSKRRDANVAVVFQMGKEALRSPGRNNRLLHGQSSGRACYRREAESWRTWWYSFEWMIKWTGSCSGPAAGGCGPATFLRRLRSPRGSCLPRWRIRLTSRANRYIRSAYCRRLTPVDSACLSSQPSIPAPT